MATIPCPQCNAHIIHSDTSVQHCRHCHTLLLWANMRFSTLQCKGCQAPISLEGELSDSKIIICHYCDTAMDSEAEFKALYTFRNIQKPTTPIEVGHKLKIKGITLSVISLIVYKSRTTQWLDFRLYSESDGYYRLIQKEGRYLFLKRTHSTSNIWLLKTGDSFSIAHQRFTISALHFSEIYYATGNIDTKINQNQRSKQCFAQDKDQWLYSSYRLNVVEYYIGEEIALPSLEG